MEKKLQNVVAYITGEMTVQETIAFDSALASSVELQQLLAETKILLAGIEQEGDRQLRAQLTVIETQLHNNEDFFNDTKTSQPMRKFGHWSLLILALGIIAFIVATLYYYNEKKYQHQNTLEPTHPASPTLPQQQELPQNKLFDSPNTQPRANAPINDELQNTALAFVEKHYQSPDFGVWRSTQSTTQELMIDSCNVIMRKQRFAKAYQYLSTITFSDNYFYKSEIMKAHCLLALRQYSKATVAFQHIVKDFPIPYSEENEYYLLLCYLTNFSRYQANYKVLKNNILKDKEHPAYDKVKQINF